MTKIFELVSRRKESFVSAQVMAPQRTRTFSSATLTSTLHLSIFPTSSRSRLRCIRDLSPDRIETHASSSCARSIRAQSYGDFDRWSSPELWRFRSNQKNTRNIRVEIRSSSGLSDGASRALAISDRIPIESDPIPLGSV
jgi:hypothetical protein